MLLIQSYFQGRIPFSKEMNLTKQASKLFNISKIASQIRNQVSKLDELLNTIKTSTKDLLPKLELFDIKLLKNGNYY